MPTTLLCADTILTLDAQDTRYAPGYLVLESDRIVELGPQAALAGGTSMPRSRSKTACLCRD